MIVSEKIVNLRLEVAPQIPILKCVRWGYQRDISLLKSSKLKSPKLFYCVYSHEALE